MFFGIGGLLLLDFYGWGAYFYWGLLFGARIKPVLQPVRKSVLQPVRKPVLRVVRILKGR